MVVWWLLWHRTILMKNIRWKQYSEFPPVHDIENPWWGMYHVWPISKCFMLGWSGGIWLACCHWLNTGMVDRRCPIMVVLTQPYPCDRWFVCSTLWELAVSNVGQFSSAYQSHDPDATMPIRFCESWLFGDDCSQVRKTDYSIHISG